MAVEVTIGSRAGSVVRRSLGIFKDCERLRGAQETWDGGSQQESQQESDDHENDYHLDERENFFNVFTARDSESQTSTHDSLTRFSDTTFRSAIGLRSYKKRHDRSIAC